MANYQAGNLNLLLSTAGSQQSVAAISTTTAYLTSLANVLKSVTPNDVKWITSLGTRIGTLGKKMEAVDWAKVQAGFTNLATAIDPFIKKVSSANSGLTSLATVLTKVNTLNSATATRGGAGFGSVLSLAKFSGAYYMARRIASVMADIIQAGSDFTETLNMWQVAFRQNLDRADEFVSKMQKAYGISTQTLMQNQAIYKNMLSQMGYISEEASYQISESLTQMMLDYSSLWNVTIDQASEKFKAMLAGQIRPIRAVSGISVEEKAIFDVYQALGGTKTMRQLTQTEKRLLRIYATFQQMNASGATGDFAKTIEKFANQSRMASENWKELVTWLGIGAKHMIETSGVMQYINALLITATEIVKALVYAGGYQDENFLDGMFETVENTNEAVDELQGKLLGFDKFRALDDNTGGGLLAIDEKVLELLSGYNSKLDSVTNKAQELASTWLTGMGFEKVNGEWVIADENLRKIKEDIDGILILVGSFIGLSIANKIAGLVLVLTDVENGFKLANIPLIALMKNLKNFSLKTLGENLWTALVKTEIGINKLIKSFTDLTVVQKIANVTFLALGASILAMGLTNFISQWDNMGGVQKAVTIFGALAAAIAGVAIAINIFKMNWVGALGVGATVAGGVLAVSAAIAQAKSVEYKANGGMVSTGTMFVAGEAGAEIVHHGSRGTGVANVDQIAQAQYKAQMMAWQQMKRDLKDFGQVTISADSQGILKIVETTAHKQGKRFAKS